MFHLKAPLTVCLLFLICAAPAVLMRDLSTVNELNYLAIARGGIEEGHFFLLGGAQYAVSYLPPLYIWVCMLSYGIAGVKASILLLGLNVIALCAMMFIVGTYFAKGLSKNCQYLTIACVVATPFLCTSSLAVSPYTINTAFLLIAIALLSDRTSALLSDPDNAIRRRRDHLIPVFMMLSCLTLGPWSFIIIPLLLITVLSIKQRLKLLFKVFPLSWCLHIASAVLVWMALTIWDGGLDKAVSLFIDLPLSFLSGEMGHFHDPFFYLWSFVLISLPIGVASVYSGIRVLLHEKSRCDCAYLFAFLTPVITLVVASLCKAQSDFYVLIALPTLGAVLSRYLMAAGARDKLVKLLLVLGLLPFSALFVVAYFLNDDFPLLNGTYVVCAFLFILLATLLSVIRVLTASVANGIATFSIGILVMILTLGFAIPNINPYFSPEIALKKAEVLAKDRGINKLCVIGIAKPWTLDLISQRLDIKVVSHKGMLNKECQGAYRLIGRPALKKWKDLENLGRQEGAFIIGENVLLEPMQTKSKTPIWSKYRLNSL